MSVHGWVYVEKSTGAVSAVGPYPSIRAADRIVFEVDWDDSVEHLYVEDCIELWSSTEPPRLTPGVVSVVEPISFPWPSKTPSLDEFFPG